ncbi:hypothetical protein [Solitalea koreensis]|uniref:Cell division protein ZapB n=1 Tax=Solitalea koreensis TaxID=543615 RepID=A0A521DT69_9SPHI|nr:hypothetical protein [Solitalea koreensis]SMO74953.1 hypothetical protein SAMN06265350_108106 [Solitalea koreensis]
MPSLGKSLDGLHLKVERLITVCESLEAENARLKASFHEMKQLAEERDQTIEELEEKLKVVRLAGSLSGSNEKTLDIKQKINDFAKEIDRCIALLNK